VVWGATDSGKGRTLVSASSPKIPAWVSAQGLTLSVTVSFTLLSDGVIGGVSLQQSSGFADVDSALLDAIRRWRFTPAAGAAPAKGIIPYVIRAR
jgi:TonB family protein